MGHQHVTNIEVPQGEISPSRFARALAVITVVGLLWRYFYISTEQPFRVLTDEGWYIRQSQRVFTNHAFTSVLNFNVPTAQHGPLLPVVLAPFSWLFPTATTTLRLVMPVIGMTAVVLLALFVRSIAGSRAGLLTAVIAAAYPGLWVRDGLVVAEPLAEVLMVLILWCAYRLAAVPRLRTAIVAGVLCGLAALTRSEMLAVALVTTTSAIVVGMRRQRVRLTAGISMLAAAVVAALVVISPWIAFNQDRFQGEVLLTNNLGITVAGANCPKAYYGPLTGYDATSCWANAQVRAAAQSSDEALQSKYMTHLGLSYAQAHTSRIPVVLVMRELWLLGLYRPGWVVKFSLHTPQAAWATWSQAYAFWLLVPFGVAGFFAAKRRKIQRWPLVIYGVNAFVIAALMVGHWRYRMTLDLALIVFAALAIDSWIARRSHLGKDRTEAPLTKELVVNASG